jgi:flagellar hook assembly protein FlgD
MGKWFIKKRFLLVIGFMALMLFMPGLNLTASAATAPSSAKEYKGHTYYVYKANVTWKKAKALCEAKGGHLVTITSAKENTFVKSLVEKANIGYCWLGATDEAKEGTWKWVTGESFKFSYWRDGEPNNTDNNEHYLSTWDYTQWNDYSNDSGSVKGYVCEWDMTKKQANSVRFAQTSTTVNYGATKTLKVLNTSSTIKWSTSNKKVATVSKKGVVTGTGLGTAKITAKVGSKKLTCTVTVKDYNASAKVTLKTTDGGYFIIGNSSAKVTFKIPDYKCAKVTATIVNASGTKIYAKTFTSVAKNKEYSFTWNGKDTKGKNVAAGSYRVKITVGTKNTYSSYLAVKKSGDFAAGNGSKNNPFQIKTITQFKKISKYPNAYFKQMTNLDFDYTAVGNFFTTDSPFNGVYDGNGKTLSKISSTYALFKAVGTKGQIKNLNMTQCNVVTNNNVDAAILVDENYGKITDCSISGTVSYYNTSYDDMDAGIITANNYGTITSCTAAGGVSCMGDDDACAGGIAGWNSSEGKIISCISTVNVAAGTDDRPKAGGICGLNRGFITYCEASGTVSVTGYSRVAGAIAGKNENQIIECIYTGSEGLALVGDNTGIVN